MSPEFGFVPKIRDSEVNLSEREPSISRRGQDCYVRGVPANIEPVKGTSVDEDEELVFRRRSGTNGIPVWAVIIATKDVGPKCYGIPIVSTVENGQGVIEGNLTEGTKCLFDKGNLYRPVPRRNGRGNH